MLGRIEKLVGVIRFRSLNLNVLKTKTCKIDVVTCFYEKGICYKSGSNQILLILTYIITIIVV